LLLERKKALKHWRSQSIVEKSLKINEAKVGHFVYFFFLNFMNKSQIKTSERSQGTVKFFLLFFFVSILVHTCCMASARFSIPINKKKIKKREGKNKMRISN
jgi:protein-S-isoprenylcysteine O-methyltransferase Ste14